MKVKASHYTRWATLPVILACSLLIAPQANATPAKKSKMKPAATAPAEPVAPAEPAAPTAPPKPKVGAPAPLNAALATSALVVTMYPDPGDGGQTDAIIDVDTAILEEDPNVVLGYSDWYPGKSPEDEIAATQEYVVDTQIEAAKKEGKNYVFFLDQIRYKRTLTYVSATPRSIVQTINRPGSERPAYKSKLSELKSAREDRDRRYAEWDAAADANAAVDTSTKEGALAGLFGAVVGLADDKGYGKAKKRVAALEAELATLNQPFQESKSIVTADVRRRLFYDGELAIYFCDVRILRCGSMTRPVSLSAVVDAPIAVFKFEPDFSAKDQQFTPWTEFNTSVAAKSKYGFNLLQLAGAADGQMMSIDATKLAAKMQDDDAAWLAPLDARDMADEINEQDVIAKLGPIAKAVETENYSAFTEDGMLEPKLIGNFVQHYANKANKAQADAEEASRRANLQGL